MAYNPSQHLPISKAFGSTGKFPLPGKYEFYTNGAGGVYSYRPYQNVAEIGTNIPAEFRRKGDTFLVNFGGTLSLDGGSITGGSNTEYWYKDDLVTPVAKLGGGLDYLTFSDSDFDGNDDDGWTLDVSSACTGKLSPVNIRIDFTGGSTAWTSFAPDVAEGIIYGLTKESGVTQELTVKIG